MRDFDTSTAAILSVLAGPFRGVRRMRTHTTPTGETFGVFSVTAGGIETIVFRGGCDIERGTTTATGGFSDPSFGVETRTIREMCEVISDRMDAARGV